jgi:hypothetical protein
LKRLVSIFGTVVAVSFFITQGAFASSVYATGSTGVDVSYPNCKVAVPSVNFGIVGVTSGLVYSHNSCVAAEAKHFSNLSLYVNTGLNASKSSSYYVQAQRGCDGNVYCAAYNYGYNAAEDALSYAQSQGLFSQKWWLDVETSATWNKNTLQNQSSLQGEYNALAESGVTLIGVYGTTAQWQSITGNWQNDWPSWGATTWTAAKQAQTYCTGHQFTGGPSLLMQFKSKQSKLDQDIAC